MVESNIAIKDPDVEPSMTLLSCLLYIIANITGMFLYWLYQQQRAHGHDECDHVEKISDWQGRKTFGGQNLHKVLPGKVLNPYQKVISIIGRTLEPLDEDNLIPAYGFGDSVTMGQSVFPFKEQAGLEVPCKGFTDVLDCYGGIANRITLGGPTNFAPIINKAVQIVRNSKRYHILIIIADGQVIEQHSTVQAIVEASLYPLSIILVGVGDGPWTTMEHFDNCLPDRSFDNFQFVNYHQVTNKCRKNPEASFALHAMMEIPDQYKTIKSLGYLDGDSILSDTSTRQEDSNKGSRILLSESKETAPNRLSTKQTSIPMRWSFRRKQQDERAKLDS